MGVARETPRWCTKKNVLFLQEDLHSSLLVLIQRSPARSLVFIVRLQTPRDARVDDALTEPVVGEYRPDATHPAPRERELARGLPPSLYSLGRRAHPDAHRALLVEVGVGMAESSSEGILEPSWPSLKRLGDADPVVDGDEKGHGNRMEATQPVGAMRPSP
jgi:hypothetical protein